MRRPGFGETLVLTSALAMGLAGCTGDDEVDPTTERPIEGITTDDGTVTFDHTLENGVVIRTEYSTDYAIKQWKITEPKTVNISLSVIPAEGESTDPAAAPLVFVEHLHADVSLEATRVGFDGMKQDSMDDSIHGATQPGFLVTPDAPYQEVFSIEGYSETLISGWGFASGGSGASEISQERLTEENLAKVGVVGNEFGLIFDIVTVDPATGMYTKSDIIVDQFFIATEAYLDQQAAAAAATTTLG
ncbi:MAG: hypothetical protein KIH63_001560 [Candidatus Saccharibacteria bacterium]|nr:hypothetical protein [Candidatus Saccharibacteria bacterium]